jgi:hypothetical protein
MTYTIVLPDEKNKSLRPIGLFDERYDAKMITEEIMGGVNFVEVNDDNTYLTIPFGQ